ncbi:hypothetical protein GIB67_025154 [Kingdonia uniflora]|uniref:Uncharacterized protein n=1 Tax=Kingdonia uniflora TaxID=39325 RepID=A0A7J7N8E1_9MAGN|nr:hypothetical protein GIB67_025154 [Kingdonia uniflora]
MGRRPCCSKEGMNRGTWTALEDTTLKEYIQIHGEGGWRNLPIEAEYGGGVVGIIVSFDRKDNFEILFKILRKVPKFGFDFGDAGLKRCGKSCRLRWLNYLRPDIKRGNFSEEEEDLIIRLHKLLGNRWSLIAGRLPGRTDNEIKNYWNTNLSKKVQSHSTSKRTHKHSTLSKEKRILINPTPPARLPPPVPTTESRVVRTKATRCTKVFFTPEVPAAVNEFVKEKALESDGLLSDFMADLDVGGLCVSEFLHSDFSDLCRFDDNNAIRLDGNINNNNDLSPPISSVNSLLFHCENIEQYWTGVNCIQRDAEEDW